MNRWWPWSIAVVLLLWQVDFQFTYGFLAEKIQQQVGLSAAEATAVSSAFLFAYGLMQIPAGLLIDRFGVRWVLPVAGWAAAFAVLFFAQADQFWELVLARIMAGVFMAFMFPSVGKIARVRLPEKRFALAMAIADMCFGIGALTAGNVSNLVARVRWEHLITVHGIFGLCVATLVAVSLRGMPKPAQLAVHETDLPISVLVTSKGVLLGAGIYVWGAGLTFGFAGYWNLKLQAACNCSAPQVSVLSSALFAGLAGGMLLAGLLASTPYRRRVVLQIGSLGTAVLLAMVIELSPKATLDQLIPLMAGLGAALGTCALAFAVAITGIPSHQSGTVVALVNAAGCLGGALLQEMPIWFGGTDEDLEAMSIIYLTIATIGVVLALLLPRSSDSGEFRRHNV